MNKSGKPGVFAPGSLPLGIFIFLGLVGLGSVIADAAIDIKQYERRVTVKGLSEREYSADIVIWPIQFTFAGNDISELYRTVESSTRDVVEFLDQSGIEPGDISVSSPAITDRSANYYGNNKPAFRYTALQTVTVFSGDIDTVRQVMTSLAELGKQGIVFSGESWGSEPEYLFTRLNDIKPEMVEEATRNAREVAEKFAMDSDSVLGKIKRATQGQFSISSRDRNNPHIKKVRVVSTVEYYLSD